VADLLEATVPLVAPFEGMDDACDLIKRVVAIITGRGIGVVCREVFEIYFQVVDAAENLSVATDKVERVALEAVVGILTVRLVKAVLGTPVYSKVLMDSKSFEALFQQIGKSTKQSIATLFRAMGAKVVIRKDSLTVNASKMKEEMVDRVMAMHPLLKLVTESGTVPL
jgi:hypothetical protein